MISIYLIHSRIQPKQEAMNHYYFLQEGIYDNEDLIEDNISEANKKIIEYKNNKKYVYVGITKDEKIANKIIKMYHNKKKDIYKEEIWISNDGLRINIEQLDLLAKKTSSFEEIQKIEEVALASYEELLKKRE